MIKINLAPQRRAKKRSPGVPDESMRPLAIGGAGLVAAALVVVLLVDRPKRTRLAELAESNDQLQGEIIAKNRQLEGYTELKKAANVLHELGDILTTSKYPTMTEDMAKRTGSGPESDPNKQFQADWDASHVWMTAFSDTGGVFKLEGGAQSENDVAQLAKRLAASVYFADVTPAGGERMSDAASGSNYYRFTITGKVAY